MRNLIKAGVILLASGGAAFAQVIISDTYDVTGSGTGFALNEGVNSEINPVADPPTTRLTGSAAQDLRYILTDAGKAASYYSISGGKLLVSDVGSSGRFTLSANGTTPFDFATQLGTDSATPENPVEYYISISIANNGPNADRCSFALGTQEGNNSTWDFGLQLYRANTTSTKYVIQKRINSGSSGLSDQNAVISTMANNTYGNEVNFLMRVTDAGPETSTFSSRIQLSRNGGNTWFYDSSSDPELTRGWRFDGSPRYVIWDVAPRAVPTYDNFKIAFVPAAPNKTITRIPGGGAKIAIADLGLAQGVSLKTVGTSPNADVSTEGGYIHYSPHAAFSDDTDSFAYTVTDGTCPNSGTITVNVVKTGGEAKGIEYSAEGISVTFAGIPEVIYDIERSDTPSGTYTSVHMFTCPADGIYTWVDQTPLESTGYYRLRQH